MSNLMASCCCGIKCPEWFGCSPYPQTITYPLIRAYRKWWETHDGTNLMFEVEEEMIFYNLTFTALDSVCFITVAADPEGNPKTQPYAYYKRTERSWTYPKLAYYGDWDPVLFCLGNCPPCKLRKPCTEEVVESIEPLTVVGTICCHDPCCPSCPPANQNPLNRMDLQWFGDVHVSRKGGTQITNGSCECPNVAPPEDEYDTPSEGAVRFWGKNGCLNTNTFNCRTVEFEPVGYPTYIFPTRLDLLSGFPPYDIVVCSGAYQGYVCTPTGEFTFNTTLNCTPTPWSTLATHANVETCPVNRCVDTHTCWTNFYGGSDSNGDGCLDNVTACCSCTTGNACSLCNNTNGIATVKYNEIWESVFDQPTIP